MAPAVNIVLSVSIARMGWKFPTRTAFHFGEEACSFGGSPSVGLQQSSFLLSSVYRSVEAVYIPNTIFAGTSSAES